jgi:TolA-binding protein
VVRASAPAISQEVLELDRAIGYLRRDRNPAAALAALDSYLGRYPHGSMEKEARLARVDALLLLGRNAQALSALEVATFEPGLRSTELLVVRAELRAATDCRRAEADFGLALGRGPDARLLERILYGRAACRAKVRDLTGAEEDLRRYLERFPAGPHADWARRSMANQGSSERER